MTRPVHDPDPIPDKVWANQILKATVPAVFLPKPGMALWLTVRRERCFVFAK